MNGIFVPRTVFVTESALRYDACERIIAEFRKAGSDIVRGNPRLPTGLGPRARYVRAKSIVVLSADESPSFLKCRPSADFQLNLVRGCPGFCEYCYLQTTMGPAPYIRVIVNVDEILSKAEELCLERLPEETSFEAAAVSDPIPVERYTGSLRSAIEFFGQLQHKSATETGSSGKGPFARLRVVTKFTDVDSLIGISHNGLTRVRFSLEAQEFHRDFEKGMASTDDKITAAKELSGAGYPIGFLFAPVFLEKGILPYKNLLMEVRAAFPNGLPPDTTFEFVSHRFTERAKQLIQLRHPDTGLPMSEAERQLKTGQFGYKKYVYPREELNDAKNDIMALVGKILPEGRIEYLV
ncbi:MAG: spore photoproduct lyase family protein [Bacillota bacterium]|jgi:spore photoproduct lyase